MELKKGDFIKCTDEGDLKEMLRALSEAGYGAVVTDVNSHYIRITSVPEK